MIIRGDIPSKSNGYKIVTINGHGSLAKTDKLIQYEQSFHLQCKHRGAKEKNPFRLDVDVYFSSNRHDLDNAMKILLDCLQHCGVIVNDRQCVEIHARKLVDKYDPRVEFGLEVFDGKGGYYLR